MRTAQTHLIPLAALLWLAPAATLAEPLRMPGDAAKAIAAFDEAAERLGKARAAMTALEAQETPVGAPRDWAGALRQIDGAAEGVRRSEGPAVPDSGAYAVSNDQLRSCATRAGALARIERYLRNIQGDIQRCADTRTWLKDRLATAQTVEEVRKSLVRSASRAASEVRLTEWFPWRWPDLEKPLTAALATYTGELRRWSDRAERGQGELKARSGVLNGQFADFGRSRDCVIAGQWVGVRTLMGEMSGLSLKLSGDGNTWTGSANVDGVDLPVRGVAYKGNTVVITLGDRKASLTGTLSGDDRTFKGTFSSGEGPAAFTLRKQ